MPLLRFDLIQGRDQASLKKLLDTAHEAMVEAFALPKDDRYQIVHQHPAEEFVIEDTGLGFRRSDQLVVLSVTTKQKTQAQKQQLYKLLAERLKERCGISPDDLMISIVENTDADWSFGQGEAQFITGKL